MKFKPDSSIKSKFGKTALEYAFIDNMHEILEYIIYNE